MQTSDWIAALSLSVSGVSFVVSLLAGRHSKKTEKVERTLRLAERLAEIEAPLGNKAPKRNPLLGRSLTSIKFDVSWEVVGPIFRFFEQLSELGERGLIDKNLASVLLGHRFKFYRSSSEWFAGLGAHLDEDISMLRRIRRLESWLRPVNIDAEPSPDDEIDLHKTREVVKKKNIEALKRIFAEPFDGATCEARDVDFDVHFTIKMDGAEIGTIIVPWHELPTKFAVSDKFVEVVEEAFTRGCPEHLHEHPGAKIRWIVKPTIEYVGGSSVPKFFDYVHFEAVVPEGDEGGEDPDPSSIDNK